MTTFIALYRGPTVADAEVVGLSADPEIVADFASRLLRRPAPPEEDPMLAPKHRAARRILRLIRTEALAAGGESR